MSEKEEEGVKPGEEEDKTRMTIKTAQKAKK